MSILIFFFKIKESKIIREHNFTLAKGQSRLDVIKYSFFKRVINVWYDCVHASRTKIYKYYVKTGYT